MPAAHEPFRNDQNEESIDLSKLDEPMAKELQSIMNAKELHRALEGIEEDQRIRELQEAQPWYPTPEFPREYQLTLFVMQWIEKISVNMWIKGQKHVILIPMIDDPDLSYGAVDLAMHQMIKALGYPEENAVALPIQRVDPDDARWLADKIEAWLNTLGWDVYCPENVIQVKVENQ